MRGRKTTAPEIWVFGMGEESYRGHEVSAVKVLRLIGSLSKGNDCLGHDESVPFAAIELPLERVMVEDFVSGHACGRGHRGQASHLGRFARQLQSRDNDEPSRNKCPVSGWVGAHSPPMNGLPFIGEAVICSPIIHRSPAFL
jgi:hypothetical protein